MEMLTSKPKNGFSLCSVRPIETKNISPTPNASISLSDTGAALTFGAGPHFCAGAAASRSLVGDVAIPKIFERLTDLRLDHEASPVQFGGWAFRGPLSVPVSWGQS